MEKEKLEKCFACFKELRPDRKSKNFKTGKWDTHTYFPCKCMNVPDKKIRILIG